MKLLFGRILYLKYCVAIAIWKKDSLFNIPKTPIKIIDTQFNKPHFTLLVSANQIAYIVH